MKFWEEMTFLDSTFIFLVCFSVLVNDNPFGFFSNSRGLRQGDSLSLFMFVIVMEALSRMFSPVIIEGFLSCVFCGV